MPNDLFMGLDAGGSKTEVRMVDAMGTASHLIGPAAHLQRHGLEATAHTLAALIREGLATYPGTALVGLCAGVAGAGRPEEQRALSDRLRACLGALAPPHLRVVHDGEVALEGAFEGASGMILIAGTGSFVLGRTRAGTLRRAGGWGYVLGDEGSGYALGLRGLRALAAAFDGGPTTRLRPRFADAFGLDTPEALIRSVYQAGFAPAPAAPIVLAAAEEGDAIAIRIVSEETAALARQARHLAHRDDGITPRLALIGGLIQRPYYREALTAALADALPGWPVVPPKHPPAIGALRFAQHGVEDASA